MQTCLSLEWKLTRVRVTRTFADRVVPWEIDGYAEDFARAEATGGVFDLSDWEVTSITGEDARDFLQRMSTVDFRKVPEGEVRHGALLTGKGQVVALGQWLEAPGGFHIIAPPPSGELALEHLEKFHFTEALEVRYDSANWAIFGIYNPSLEVKEELGLGRREMEPLKLHTAMPGSLRFELWRDDSRHKLWWVRIKRDSGVAFLKWLHDLCVLPLGRRLFEYYRIANAVPQVGVEATEKNLILETGFDRAVARNKGCYPGQEVVERIFTYGQVNKRLMPVELEVSASFPPLPLPLVVDGKEAGSVVSYAMSPESPDTRGVGLAFVHRSFWERSEPFPEVSGARVMLRSK